MSIAKGENRQSRGQCAVVGWLDQLVVAGYTMCGENGCISECFSDKFLGFFPVLRFRLNS